MWLWCTCQSLIAGISPPSSPHAGVPPFTVKIHEMFSIQRFKQHKCNVIKGWPRPLYVPLSSVHPCATSNPPPPQYQRLPGVRVREPFFPLRSTNRSAGLCRERQHGYDCKDTHRSFFFSRIPLYAQLFFAELLFFFFFSTFVLSPPPPPNSARPKTQTLN